MENAIVTNPFFWIMLGGMLISTIARVYMNSSFKNLLDEMMRKNWKAPRLVQDVLDFYQVKDVKLERREGSFNDRYLPMNKTLYISSLAWDSSMIAALAGALHEAGHAIQSAKGLDWLFSIRRVLHGILRLCTRLALIAFIVSIFISNYIVMYWSFVPFAAAFVWDVLFFPLELAANNYVKKADGILSNFTKKEKPILKRLLFANSLTYLATSFQAIVDIKVPIVWMFGKMDQKDIERGFRKQPKKKKRKKKTPASS